MSLFNLSCMTSHKTVDEFDKLHASRFKQLLRHRLLIVWLIFTGSTGLRLRRCLTIEKHDSEVDTGLSGNL